MYVCMYAYCLLAYLEQTSVPDVGGWADVAGRMGVGRSAGKQERQTPDAALPVSTTHL